VLVVSATDADPGGVRNQKYWLALSARSGRSSYREATTCTRKFPSRLWPS
jgi:hypothetical protein